MLSVTIREKETAKHKHRILLPIAFYEKFNSSRFTCFLNNEQKMKKKKRKTIARYRKLNNNQSAIPL